MLCGLCESYRPWTRKIIRLLMSYRLHRIQPRIPYRRVSPEDDPQKHSEHPHNHHGISRIVGIKRDLRHRTDDRHHRHSSKHTEDKPDSTAEDRYRYRLRQELQDYVATVCTYRLSD